MNVKNKTVFVGLSGGVDSAVSAALLQREGANVVGVYIKGWYPPGMPCTWAAERRDAMRVAAQLHIQFRTLDASVEYKKGVIDYLLSEYRLGRTPNPDVMCNKEVKFGAFFKYAMTHGADYIATGHYRSGEKDQSYFLWNVPKEALAKTLFPVGHLAKSKVRALARQFGLPVAQKKDSQGICFLGSISVDEFLRGEFGTHPGICRDESGADVGRHNGALLHTLGERVSLNAGPWYVIAKNIERNELTVSHTPKGRSNELTEIHFSSPNWIGDAAAVTNAQYRYRGKRVRGTVRGSAFVLGDTLSETPAPGQSLVFYKDDELQGGAIIAG